MTSLRWELKSYARVLPICADRKGSIRARHRAWGKEIMGSGLPPCVLVQLRLGCCGSCVVLRCLRHLLRHLRLLRELGAAIAPLAEGGPGEASEPKPNVVFPFEVALEAILDQRCLLDGPRHLHFFGRR